MTYYFSNHHNGVVIYNDDGSVITIPNDKGNRDWQVYLAYMASGGGTQPAKD